MIMQELDAESSSLWPGCPMRMFYRSLDFSSTGLTMRIDRSSPTTPWCWLMNSTIAVYHQTRVRCSISSEPTLGLAGIGYDAQTMMRLGSSSSRS